MKYHWTRLISNQWKLDQDYVYKLTPAEAQWLYDFNQAFVGGKFDGDVASFCTHPASKRKVWRDNYRNHHDLMSNPQWRSPTSYDSLGDATETESRIILEDLLKDKKLRFKMIRSLRNE